MMATSDIFWEQIKIAWTLFCEIGLDMIDQKCEQRCHELICQQYQRTSGSSTCILSSSPIDTSGTHIVIRNSHALVGLHATTIKDWEDSDIWKIRITIGAVDSYTMTLFPGQSKLALWDVSPIPLMLLYCQEISIQIIERPANSAAQLLQIFADSSTRGPYSYRSIVLGPHPDEPLKWLVIPQSDIAKICYLPKDNPGKFCVSIDPISQKTQQLLYSLCMIPLESDSPRGCALLRGCCALCSHHYDKRLQIVQKWFDKYKHVCRPYRDELLTALA